MKIIGQCLRRRSDRVAVRLHLAQVATRAEESTLRREYHHLDSWIAVALPSGLNQLARHVAVQAVRGIGPIQCNPGNRIPLFEYDAVEFTHVGSAVLPGRGLK